MELDFGRIIKLLEKKDGKMALKKYKLGELIEQRREKYDGISELPIRGVSRDGFIDVKQAGADTSLYNTFYLNDFVFNPARMEINSIALNVEYDKAICSSLYEIFYVNDTTILIPEYLNLFVKRNEFARHCEFIGWGSVREYCRVGNISELEIALPPLSIQRKYVAIYQALLANQRAYEQGLEDLDVAIVGSIEKFKHSSPRIAVGKLLEQVDERNRDGKITNVQGININKEFIPSVANLSSTDLTKYKVIRKNQFAANFMHVMRDEKIPFGLYSNIEPCIISPAYPVFQVKNDKILPEFLMLWLNRPEIDRIAWFIADSSIRGGLEIERFYEIEIPLPTIPQQQALVNFYHVRRLMRQNTATLGEMIKDVCPILIKGSLEEAER